MASDWSPCFEPWLQIDDKARYLLIAEDAQTQNPLMTHHVLVMEIRHQAALDFIASVCNLVDFRLDGDRVLWQRVDSP